MAVCHGPTKTSRALGIRESIGGDAGAAFVPHAGAYVEPVTVITVSLILHKLVNNTVIGMILPMDVTCDFMFDTTFYQTTVAMGYIIG